MRKTDLAYYAGIFDGEGAVGISRHKREKLRRGYNFLLIVQVTSLNEWLVHSLKFAFGGSVTFSKSGFKTAVPSWHWQLCSRKAGLFLKTLLPYLKLKRYQAEIAIEFQQAKNYGPRTDEEMAIEEAQRILIHSQTRKGKRLDATDI